MLDKKFISSLKENYSEKNSQRRQIISASNIILNNSKKAIFANAGRFLPNTGS